VLTPHINRPSNRKSLSQMCVAYCAVSHLGTQKKLRATSLGLRLALAR